MRLYRLHPDRQLIQIVIYLRPTNSPLVYIETFEGNNISHRFRVIRLWEQPTEAFLTRPGLWPYATLTEATNKAGILRQIAQKKLN